MENETPNKTQEIIDIDINNIPDKSFILFQMSITPDKISSFFDQGIMQNEKSNSKDFTKLNKADFFLIFNSLFSKGLNNVVELNQIYFLIFQRLKERKCVFKINSPFSSKNYALADITSTEKIEIYIVQLFLSAIMITNYKNKLESMFNVTDTDNDKLINEDEIKKLVITTNKLFYEDSKEKFSKSSLIQQAIANFKANKALSKLLYGKSDLKKILEKEKYINFEQFYERLIMLDNYMYDIIPMFINIKKFLSNKQEEIEMYMDDKCKKDFVDISYELINKNNLISYVSPRNYMKQFFDKKKKVKKKKIDPLKEIKEKKERQKELRMQRMIEMKKREFGKKYNPILRLSLTKSNLSSPNININPQTVKKILDEKEFNYNTPVINNNNSNSNSNKQINTEEEKYQNKNIFTTNRNYKKLNTAEFNEKLKLYSKKEKEEEKSSEKKLPNSFPLLKETRRKSILNKIFDIPSEVTPFNITEKSSRDKNNNIPNNNKVLSFSMSQKLIDKKGNQISENNLESNLTTLGLLTPVLSTKENSYLNFKKISINNKKQNREDIWQTANKVPIRKGNKLIEPLSPNYSLLNTTSRKYFPNIPFMNSVESGLNKKSKEKSVEFGDYHKFSEICFPPCIIKTKEKNNSHSFSLSKREKSFRRIKKVKYKGFDFSKTLLNTYDEVKNNILDEIEQQRNYDLNGLNAILKIKKSILDKTSKFHFVDFNKNKISLKNLFVFNHHKKKK
jgi:hypothetical protein